jgi:hypothetical protein
MLGQTLSPWSWWKDLWPIRSLLGSILNRIRALDPFLPKLKGNKKNQFNLLPTIFPRLILHNEGKSCSLHFDFYDLLSLNWIKDYKKQVSSASGHTSHQIRCASNQARSSMSNHKIPGFQLTEWLWLKDAKEGESLSGEVYILIRETKCSFVLYCSTLLVPNKPNRVFAIEKNTQTRPEIFAPSLCEKLSRWFGLVLQKVKESTIDREIS